MLGYYIYARELKLVNYFADRDSAIFIASLDFCKAFDKVSHTKLFDSLIEAGISGANVKVLCNWYGKLYLMSRWNCSFSNWFVCTVVSDKVVFYFRPFLIVLSICS